MFKTIDEALQYIESKRTKRTFKQFQETIKKYSFNIHQKNSIHVAGTNGKGSTVNYVKEIFMKHGYRVGTFTSPYMIAHNDRICINGIPISDNQLLQYINELYSIIEKEQLSMFEIDVLIMLKYFDKEELDFRIIETGIGGKTDKTNVIDSRISAITNIGYDHQFMLGNTLRKIAKHKAGIIKEKQVFVTTETNVEILSLFKEVCNKNNTAMEIVKPLTKYALNTLASYQRNNVALAIAIASKCISLEEDKVQEALMDFQCYGRFEQFGNVYLDGAHNIAGINALIQTIKDNNFTNVAIVFSALGDKDSKEMVLALKDYVVIEASFVDERSVTKAMPFQEALSQARQYDVIIVTGSLHFISTVRKYITS